jgi:hydroxymethylpyrimidine pyrophosphatase-like HAD family hydrolase
MRFLLLATDYDGTLACDGTVADKTQEALERLLASGRRLLLVTGRHLLGLREIFPRPREGKFNAQVAKLPSNCT